MRMVAIAHHLNSLFYVLNSPKEKRLTNLDESLADFSYVNGNLFAETLPPAQFDAKMREALLYSAAYFSRIPLKATPHIICANALQTDWAEVLPPARCSYVLGNPPFWVRAINQPRKKLICNWFAVILKMQVC